MTLFLEQWVQCRLGVSVDFANVGTEFFDGTLFFKILQSYDVVGSDVQHYFYQAQSPEEALNNLNLLRVTFKLLGVLRNEDVLEEISRKNGAACVDLLNQLYLKLSNKQSLPVVTDGKKNQVLRQETGRFKVSKVKEKKCVLPQRKRPEEKLLSRLENSIKVFGKNAGDSGSLKSPKESKFVFSNSTKRIKEEIEKKLKGCKCGATLEDCLKKFDERIEQQAAGDTLTNICPPDDYVKMLKLRTIKQATDKEIETKLRDIIIKKVWCKQMQQREDEFRCSLAEKLLKQSNYEREMAQRLGQIHLRHKMIVEKRRRIHEECQRLYMERLETIDWQQNSLTDLDNEREKQRLQDLHRKIFDERIAAVQRERLTMIREVVFDLIDFSIKCSSFESENSVKISDRELKLWKAMFVKGLPLLPKVQDLKLVEEEQSETGSNESFESYIGQENFDDGLNDYALNEYMVLLGPWAKELWPELETVEEEMEVLGFAVHRLLEFKYPLPQPPDPADVPLYPVRAILNNINDTKALKTLKSLLEKPKIDLIELPALINSCVVHYKKEVGLDVKPNKKKDKSELTVKKGGKKGKEEEPKFKSVEIQYPSLIDTEPKLSKYAELGKMSFEILGSGSPVPDELVTEILIEYLRNLTDKEGWALVNFPTDCRQVFCLESKLTGIEPPIKCDFQFDIMNEDQKVNGKENRKISSEMGISESMFYEDFSIGSDYNDTQRLNDLRTSKLVPRPNPPPPTIVFKPYFTRFIHIEQVTNNLESSNVNTKQENGDELNDSNEESSKEVSLEEETPISFYTNNFIHSLIPYNKLDLTVLKKVGRAILNEIDEDVPERKASIELFGDVAKEKTSKKDLGKNKKIPPSRKLQSISEKIVIDESLSSKNKSYETIKILKEESVVCPTADPTCWVFTTLEIPTDTKIALASLWESIEITYIQNLIDLFSFYREHDSCVVPYRNLVFKQLNEIMQTSDERQELVDEFLSQLNSINNIIRPHGEIKKEMFCRIFELQLKLWELCDLKKTSCEAERKAIIKENWLPAHLRGLFNIYLSMLETEMDRFTDSIQFLQDYYFSCFGKLLSPAKIEKFYLPRCKTFEYEIRNSSLGNVVSTSKVEVELSKSVGKGSQSKRTLDIIFNSDGILEYFTDVLTNPEFETNLEDPYIRNMNEFVSKVITEISNLTNQQLSIIEKEKKNLFPAKNPKSRAKTAKKMSMVVKDKSDKSNLSQKLSTELEEDALKKENFMKAYAEWAKGVQDEMDRTVFRTLLIRSRFQNDINELKILLSESFHGLHNEISTRYFQQTKDCDNLLRVLMAAVEVETKVETKLVLTLERFYIEPETGTQLHTPPPPTPIDEIEDDFIFTIQQLNKFAEKMVIVSPLGITVETLIAVIEDMALMGKENGYPYLPIGWSQVNRREIRKIIHGIFGDVVVVDWKDFLIYALEFRFPTLQELMETREKFILLDPNKTETVNFEGFNKITFWFERDLCETLEGDLRIVLGKQFLFDLYRVNHDEMNYTAFLLNYCKDETPINGFGKALALSSGICYVMSEEKIHLLNLDSKSKEANLIAKQIINILLQDTLNRAEGTVITEVDDDGNKIEDFEEFVKSDFGFMRSEKIISSIKTARESVRSMSLKGSKSRSSLKPRQTQDKPRESAGVKSHESGEAKSSVCQQDNLEITNEQDSVDYQTWETNVVWKSWIPRELVLSLLLASLQSYALPEDQFYIQTELEEELSKLYIEKGTRDCIQGYILGQSQFIKDVFSKCFKFKMCRPSLLIKTSMDVNRMSNINTGG